jgi:hypothetical protein
LPIASESLVELIALHAQRRDLPMEDLLPMADDAVRWVIQRCLAHSPEERYSCGRQLADELRALYGSHRSLENLLRESLGGTGVTLSGSEDRFVVRVPLPEGRFQEVFVEICRRSSVAEQVVKIYSVCGPVDESYFRQALELNAETPHGSIAIQTVNNQPRFVMSNAYPRATCDEEEVRQSVLMIAQRADEVERLLTGGDAF